MLTISVLLLLLGTAAGCVVKDSPVPGCVQYWPFAPMGGCLGKSIIKDLMELGLQ